MSLQKYLSVLFNDDELVNLRLLPEKNGTASPVNVLETPDALRTLTRRAKMYETQRVFACVGVNPRNNASEVSAYKNIVVDIDDALLPPWAHERADMICSRDETHHHLYFCFASFGPSDEARIKYSAIVKTLLTLSNSKEKSAHDPERVIRLPYFSHGKSGKPAPGYKIVFIRDDIKREAFAKKFAWLKIKDETSAMLAEAKPLAEKTYVNSIQYLKNLYLKKPTLGTGDGRSRELFFIGLDAHAWGIPQSDAEALAATINREKFAQSEPHEVVLHQISSAYRYRRGEFGSLLNAARGQTERQQIRARMLFETVQRARDLLADFVYVHSAERLINRTTRFELTTISQINNYIISQLGEKVTLEELLKAQAIECADVLDFAPSEPQTFKNEGKIVFNRYVAGRDPLRDKAQAKKAVKIFREHIAYLATSEHEEKTLLQFFAFMAQRPGEKLAWAILLISRHTGVGKSALAELSAQILGAHNVGYAESDDLVGQHTDYIAEKLLVIAHELETGDKNVMRRLKSLITEPRVRVIAKYARTYETHNRANFLFFSNRIDAIRVDDNDRRLFIVYNRREPKPQAYYDALFAAFKNGAGYILDYLCTVDLSGFNPHARPGQTEGRTLLTEHSETELSSFLRETETARESVFAEPFFSSRKLYDYVIFNAPEPARKFATPRQIARWLDYRGYTSYEYHDKDEAGVRKHFTAWHKGDRESFERARKIAKTSEVKKL